MVPRMLLRFSIRGLMAAVLASAFVCFAVIRVGPFRWPGAMGCRWTTSSNIRQISLALALYHQDHGRYPPASVADEFGHPLYSWRVLILPYLDEKDLYRSFHLAESWDSPHNLPVSRTLIRRFHSVAAYDPVNSPFTTDFVLITGVGSQFPDSGARPAVDVGVGATCPILVAEIAGSKIPWAAPGDLDRSTMSFRVDDPSRPGISSKDPGGPCVASSGGTVRGLGRATPPAVVQSMTMCRIAGTSRPDP